MEPITFLGLFAAACTTVAYLPQAIKTVRTKQTQDLSLIMYIVLNVGIVSWLIYGIFIKNAPLIAANAITLVLTGWILILKIKYK